MCPFFIAPLLIEYYRNNLSNVSPGTGQNKTRNIGSAAEQVKVMIGIVLKVAVLMLPWGRCCRIR